jgi:hypothetical protein
VGEPFTVEFNIELVRDIITTAPPPPTTVEHAALEAAIGDDDLDAEHDDAPLWLCPINDVIRDAANLGLARQEFNDELNFTSVDEPSTFHEAECEQTRRQAMIDELKLIEDNKTWELTSLLAGHRAIGLTWVYKVQGNKASNIVRHKVWLVGKGYIQRLGINFNEVFAPVARLESVQMMVAFAAHEHWTIHHMDVKSTFLNGTFKEEVFVHQPSGFIINGSEDKVMCLHKALYGLRRTPRAWNAKLDTTMVELGF